MSSAQDIAVFECQRTVTEKKWWGHSTRKCGRRATKMQDDGLPLCDRHYAAWLRKKEWAVIKEEGRRGSNG